MVGLYYSTRDGLGGAWQQDLDSDERPWICFPQSRGVTWGPDSGDDRRVVEHGRRGECGTNRKGLRSSRRQIQIEDILRRPAPVKEARTQLRRAMPANASIWNT